MHHLKALISSNSANIDAQVFQAQTASQQLIIINGAPGVPKEFYFPIAHHLSNRLFTVVAFDYPTVSVTKQKINWHKDIEKLGELIFESVLEWCGRIYPKHTVHVIGHGAGANIVGYAPSCGKIASLITIGANVSSAKTLFENGLLLYDLYHKLIRQLRFTLTGRSTTIPLHKLANLDALRNNRKALRTSIVAMNRTKTLAATHFANFTGRLLTLAPHDDVLPFKEKNELIPTLCNHAIKRTRHLYAEDIEDNYIGFFGVFSERKDNILWNMIADWISDNTRFEDPPFGKFDDREFPLVVVTITDIDPTPELLADYLATMKKNFERGPVFLLIDLTHVHWADSRLPRMFNQWILENSELVKRNHRYTVYVAPNFFIRNFLIIFHSLPFTNIIRPQQVFKLYSSGITWLRKVVEQYKLNSQG